MWAPHADPARCRLTARRSCCVTAFVDFGCGLTAVTLRVCCISVAGLMLACGCGALQHRWLHRGNYCARYCATCCSLNAYRCRSDTAVCCLYAYRCPLTHSCCSLDGCLKYGQQLNTTAVAPESWYWHSFIVSLYCVVSAAQQISLVMIPWGRCVVCAAMS